jgi:putative ABC transport system substrate-binding protein
MPTALTPDVILANGASTLGPLQQLTHTLPIVFVQTNDPVGGGYVASLTRPGGNATGFMTTEYSTSGKWLELLKPIAPGVKRVAVLRDPALGVGTTQFAVIQVLAPILRMEVTPVNVRDLGEFERAATAFARESNGGLIVTSSTLAQIRRERIITLAARHRLPAVYPFRFFITSGGLISYGPEPPAMSIALKGEKPSDLPVQGPTKSAKALGITIPETLLATADEVIQ